MKLMQVLDTRATALSMDPKNVQILSELLQSEYSVTELARRLNMPTVTLWKRMQKLLAAKMVELSEIRKSGNLEKKMYRAAAANYIPANLLVFKPSDKHLSEAYDIYSQIRMEARQLLTSMNEIPEGANPVDYALYATMRAFVAACGTPDSQRRIAELEKKLAEFMPGAS